MNKNNFNMRKYIMTLSKTDFEALIDEAMLSEFQTNLITDKRKGKSNLQLSFCYNFSEVSISRHLNKIYKVFDLLINKEENDGGMIDFDI